jgi:hypothetical protein
MQHCAYRGARVGAPRFDIWRKNRALLRQHGSVESVSRMIQIVPSHKANAHGHSGHHKFVAPANAGA